LRIIKDFVTGLKQAYKDFIDEADIEIGGKISVSGNKGTIANTNGIIIKTDNPNNEIDEPFFGDSELENQE